VKPGIVVAATVLLGTIAVEASAQELNLYDASAERPNVVWANTGLDHGLVGEIGYARVLESGRRRFFVGGDFEMPWAQPDFGDFRLRADLSAVLLGRTGDRWHLALALCPTLRETTNVLARMTALGADTRLTGGWYAPAGFVAAEAGVDWSASTYIANSDLYRRVAYADAKDGFYGNTGGTIYAALVGGLSFDNWGVVLRGGMPRGIDLQAQNLPFFATLGVSYMAR
jgi:hypothetical protein